MQIVGICMVYDLILYRTLHNSKILMQSVSASKQSICIPEHNVVDAQQVLVTQLVE